MSRLLVKVKKNRWLKSPRPSYLQIDDVPGDCLQDLRISNNELSVWSIESDNSNLNRVMTALAGNQDSMATCDFLLFDEGVITMLGLKMKATVGNAPDREAANRWHRDLIELSGKKALTLVLAIFEDAERVRFWEHQIHESLRDALSLGHIDRASLKSSLVAKLASEPSTPHKTTPSPTPAIIAEMKSPAPLTAKKERPQGFKKMCVEIVSFSRGAWRRYLNSKSKSS